MSRIDAATVARIENLLAGNWRPAAIANTEHVNVVTVYRIQSSLCSFGTPYPPSDRTRGRPRIITVAAGKLLLEQLKETPWIYRDEMKEFLWEECGIECSAMAVGRFLRRNNWSYKVGQRISDRQSQTLRRDWQALIVELHAEKLVFVDESLFNETTGWRKKAWGPVGSPARWHDDRTRGEAWSILPAYMVNGYLPCLGVKKGYYNAAEFLDWIVNCLLPECPPESVIIMDNNSTHVNEAVTEAIIEAGFRVLFLPPYSPDYNPIELTFSILKAWVKRYFHRERNKFDDFGLFLRYAVQQSGCDRFGEKHFRKSADSYMFEGDYEAFQRELDLLLPI